MAIYGRDDDYLQLIALLFIGFFALLFILSVCGKTSQACPDGYYQCSSSPCGCCKQGQDGSVDVCSACQDYISVGGKCCQKSNLDNCISSQSVCVFPPMCVSDADCGTDPCPASRCETQPDGTGKCKPCEKGAVCNPLVKSSCCSGMICDARTSTCQPCEAKACMANEDCCDAYACTPQADGSRKCEPCLDQPCDTRPCCPGYECSVQPGGSKLCKPCEGVLCVSSKDCCNGYGCFNGKCIACGGKTCSKDSDCCNGYGCILQAEGTKKCQPCAAGLDCSRQQCCPGMQCTQFPDGTKKCQPCAGRQCASQSDCCKGDMCVNGQCRSLSSCAGVPCTTPGESCKLCADARDPATCSRCTDNTICANDGSGKFVCQPACQAGGVVCGTCQTGCCDPLTGKCACGPGEHACENVEGCACCTYGAQTVQACPQGMLMCPGYGCAPPFICTKDPVFKTSICRPTTDIKCEKGTFECAQHKNACCTYIVPADAIPPGISAVDTKTCPSGYGIIMQFDRGSANFRKFVCCEKVSYKLEGKTYQYSFTCGGSTYTGTSAASSYEYMVSTTKALSENFCKEVASTCAAQGIPLEQCFTKPIQAQVGGS